MTVLDLSWDRDRWLRELERAERELARQARAAPRTPDAASLRSQAPILWPQGFE